MIVHEGIDAADWVTLWQSEMAALAVDRECHETLVAMATAWAVAVDPTARRTSADAPPGASPAGLAPELGGELDELRRRVAELERAAT